MIPFFAFSQGTDDCISANFITNLDDNCFNSNNNAAATADVANGDCISGTNNFWYTFTAVGSELDVAINNAPATAELTLVQFDTDAAPLCDFIGYNFLACEITGTLEFNSLVPGNQYFIVVTFPADETGSYEFCIDNPIEPVNNNPCGTPTVINADGSCTTGTTAGATGEIGVAICLDNELFDNQVWYQVDMVDPNVGFEIAIDNECFTGDVGIVVVTLDCAANTYVEQDFYCGSPPAIGSEIFMNLNATGPGTYFIGVSTYQDGSGCFDLCVEQVPPPPGCSVNDDCLAPENVAVINNQTTCVPGCNILASPGPFFDSNAGCFNFTFPTVWYEVVMPAGSGELDVEVSSVSGILNPQVAIFTSADCATYLQLACDQGPGTVDVSTTALQLNTYLIAVQDVGGLEGEFDICITPSAAAGSNCASSGSVYIASRSEGTGNSPIQPGEIVEICLSVNDWDSGFGTNNCQWIHGIVPSFGACWKTDNFDASGQPINITNTLAGDGGGAWAWFDDGVALYNNIPNARFNPGEPVGAGWFVTGVPGDCTNCTVYTDPNCTWGSAPSGGCSDNNNNVWDVCFELEALEYPECNDDPSYIECAIEFFAFGDGETGGWCGGGGTAGAPGCQNDQEFESQVDNLNCCVGPELDDLDAELCSGSSTLIVLSTDQGASPAVNFIWEAVPNASIAGAFDDFGPFIAQTLITTNGTQVQTYIVTPISITGCYGEPQPIEVTVYEGIDPNIEEVEPICQNDPMLITLTSDPIGGDGNYTYEWNTITNSFPINGVGNPFTVPENPFVGTSYVVTVTDGTLCMGVDTITVLVKPQIDVEAFANGIDTCESYAPFTLTANPLFGVEPFQYDWPIGVTPIGNGETATVSAATAAPFIYTVTVTDANECTGTADVEVWIIEEPTPDIIGLNENTDFPIQICPGTDTSFLITSFGGPGNSTASWVTPNGTQSFSNEIVIDADDIDPNTGYGEYLVIATEITSFEGCVDTLIVPVELIAPPVPVIIGSDLCPGQTGTLMVDGTFDSYEWSSNVTGSTNGQSTTVTGPGTYSVTVGVGTCFGNNSIDINTLPIPEALIMGDPTLCENTGGQLWVADTFAFVSWNDGSTADTLNIAGPGNYSVTVTSTNGCTDEVDYLVSPILGDQIEIMVNDTAICEGELTVLSIDGALYTDVLWSTGETSDQITVSSANSYMVTAVNAESCPTTDLVILTSTTPMPEITGTDQFCINETTELGLTSTWSSYSWSTGETTATIQAGQAITYMVTVTDEEGCTGEDFIDVTQYAVVEPGITGVLEVCPGADFTLTAGDGFTAYEWNTNELTQTINPSDAGVYTVTATDGEGCKSESTITIDFYDVPNPDLGNEASFCVNGTVNISPTITTGLGPYTYSWSTGSVDDNVDVGIEGTITVEVTDANGCIGSASIEVTEKQELTPSIGGITDICDGDQTTLSVNGTFDSYSWSWNNGANTSDQSEIIVDEGISYFLTVTDANNCTGDTMVTVELFTPPVANLMTLDSICDDNTEGLSLAAFEDLIISGQTDGSWSWDGTAPVGVTGSFPNLDFNGVDKGTYTLVYTISDVNGVCQDEVYMIDIVVYNCGCPEFTTPDDVCNDMANIVDLFALLEADAELGGTWQVNSSSANPPVITNGMLNTQNADEGIYEIEYIYPNAVNGCSSWTQSFMIFGFPNAGTASAVTPECEGESMTFNLNDYLTDADVGGSWSTAAGTTVSGGAFNASSGSFAMANQTSGTYTFEYTVMGSGPCGDDVEQVVIDINSNPVADAGGTLVNLTCEDPNVTLGGSATTVGPGVTYTWNGDPGNATITGITTPGVYTLVVTDANGCTDSDQIEVALSNDIPELNNAIEGDISCFGENDGFINLNNIEGGTGPYTITLNDSDVGSQTEYNDLAEGTYVFVVEDVNGCSSEATFIIEEPALIDVSLGETIVQEFGEELTLSAVVTGDAVDSYWTGLDPTVDCGTCTSVSFTPEMSGSYTITVVDQFGCEASSTINVILQVIRKVYIPNVFTPNDDGINDLFTVYTNNDVLNVSQFAVYNRWGDIMFEQTDIQPNIESEGWDGTFKGQKLQLGVYVYRIEVEYRDGEKETFYGDISIVE